MPHAQACVSYILRVAVIRQLPEQGQRKLLDRLVATAAGGIAPPLVIAALEGMGALLEILGEVPPEAAAAVEQVCCLAKLRHPVCLHPAAEARPVLLAVWLALICDARCVQSPPHLCLPLPPARSSAAKSQAQQARCATRLPRSSPRCRSPRRR